MYGYYANRDRDKNDSSSAPGSERTNFGSKRPEQVGIRRVERASGPENRRFWTVNSSALEEKLFGILPFEGTEPWEKGEGQKLYVHRTPDRQG